MKPHGDAGATHATRCVVHIGAPKTGSTAVQSFLESNREVLQRHGVLYPDVCLRGFGHHDLAFLLAGGYPEWATPQPRPLEDLLAEMGRRLADPPPLVILSSENFYLYPRPEELAEAVRRSVPGLVEFTVVAYVRRQDEAHVSWYNQAVKAQGFTGTVHECIAASWERWDYERNLRPWASTFGADDLRVRPYQPSDLDGEDVRVDFARLLDLPLEAMELAEAPINTRLNSEFVQFQRSVNRLPLTPQEKRRFHRELMELTRATAGTGLFDDAPLLSSSERAEVLQRYESSNAEVARRYLSRSSLFDAELPDDDGREPTRALTPESLAAILAWILARE